MARVQTTRRRVEQRSDKVKGRGLKKRGFTRHAPRHRKKVRFAKYETSGRNTRFRRTKAALKPLRWRYAYRHLLLMKPCCNHMRNYQDSVVEMFRSERAFLLAHVQKTKRGRARPRQVTNPFARPYIPGSQNVGRKFLIPNNPLPDLGGDVILERNKLRGPASRKSRFHLLESAEKKDQEGEDSTMQVFVDPAAARTCEGDPARCNCSICRNFL